MLETQMRNDKNEVPNDYLRESTSKPAMDYSYDEGFDIQTHAKHLCVNKMGHTMIPPPEEGTGSAKFRQLFRRHRLKTITYCSVFWSFGMCVAFLGPTLLDLECRISTVFSTMSWIFFSQSLFTLLGSACGGYLVQRIGCHRILLVSITMLSVTLVTIPSCSFLWTLAGVLAIMGFFMGTIDTVANISMIQLYGKNVAPFLQALHFSYGLGAFLSPIIAEPFLLNQDCTQFILNSTLNKHTVDFSANLSRPLEEIEEAQHHSRIQYAFWILSGLQTPVIALVLLVVLSDLFGWNLDADKNCADDNDIYEMKSENEKINVSHKVNSADKLPVTKNQVFLITFLTASVLFLYDGLQAGFGGYIFSYAVKSIAGMSMNEAAYLNACFWGTFAFGRLMSIGFATKLAPTFMLFCNITGCMFAMTLMLSFPHNHRMLYIGTGLFGTFLSSIYPTVVSLAETDIQLTSSITTLLVVSAAAGEMVLPVIIGHVFSTVGPETVLIAGIFITFLSFIIYGVLYYVTQSISRQSSEQSALLRFKHIFRPPKDGNDIDEDSGMMKHHVKFYRRMASDLSESALGDLNSSQPVGDTRSDKEVTSL